MELAFETPTRLGRYEVIRHLATGGMAEVLLARGHDEAGVMRHVVIKHIRPDQRRDHRFVQMFLDEARIASSLAHPNIVRVFDISGAEEGECYFAMEYVHGEDLRRVLAEVYRQRDKMPIALVTGIVAGAAAGLHHAHTQVGPDRRPLNIVHRDVSPANILVGYDGAVKVTDFGIAKAALRTVETRSGTLKGKVSYMSPEQVTGKEIDRRSDVFALGIVLYEVATARRLFKGDNDFLTMNAIVQGDIPRPSVLRPDLPRILEDIIMTALSGNPKDRFQSAEELRGELEAFTSSLGMRMTPTNIADYMKKLFGQRAEPWLVDDDPTLAGQTYEAITIDFDGTESGVVRTPNVAIKSHAFPPALRPSPSSPIAFALESAGGTPAVRPDTQVGSPLGPATTTGMAWVNEPSNVSPKRSRGRVFVMAFVAAVVAGGGMYGVMRMTGDDRDATKLAASPPPTVEVKAVRPDPKDSKSSNEPNELTDPKEQDPNAPKDSNDPKDQDDPNAALNASNDPNALKDPKASNAADARDAPNHEDDPKQAAKTELAKREADPKAARRAKLEAAKQAADKKAAARLAKVEAARIEAERREADRRKKREAARAKAEAAKKAIAKAEAARKKPATKKPTKPPAKPSGNNGSAWDPNALFAPK